MFVTDEESQPWREEMTLPQMKISESDIISLAEQIVNDWNSSLKLNEIKREFIKVEKEVITRETLHQ